MLRTNRRYLILSLLLAGVGCSPSKNTWSVGCTGEALVCTPTGTTCTRDQVNVRKLVYASSCQGDADCASLNTASTTPGNESWCTYDRNARAANGDKVGGKVCVKPCQANSECQSLKWSCPV